MVPSYGSKKACPEVSSRDGGCGAVVAVVPAKQSCSGFWDSGGQVGKKKEDTQSILLCKELMTVQMCAVLFLK